MSKKFYLGTTIAAVAFATTAFAQNSQQQAQAQSGGLEEIVVTAQRREESLQETPIPVSAFTADMLEKRQVTQATDLERYVPSLKMRNNITSPTNLSPSLRGSLQQDASLVVAESPFGIYVDDTYIGRLNGNNVTLADFERVEVLRGPQGTLYGRNTLAGAIKFITKTPGPDNEWFNAEAGYGSFDSWKVSVSGGGGISDKAGASLALQKNSRGGIWYNRATNQDIGGEDNVAGRGKLHFMPSDSFDLVTSLSYTRSTNDGLMLVPGTTPSVAANRQFTSDDVVPRFGPYSLSHPAVALSPSPIRNDSHGNTKQWIASVNATWNLSDNTSIQSITSFVGIDDYFNTDFSGSGSIWAASNAKSDQFTQELKVQGKAFDDRLNYITGVYYLNESAKQDFGWRYLTPSSTSLIDADTESFAFYAQGDYQITDQLKATAGIRWLQDDKEFRETINVLPTSIVPATAAGTAPVSLNNKYEKWAPKFGLDYEVPTSGNIDSLLLYTSVARGFKSGGYSAIAIFNLNDARSPYGPESNWTYEVGAKSDMFDNRLRFNANAFYNRISDLTLNATVTTNGINSFPVQNAGDATIKGVEIESTLVPTDGLTLFANVAFMGGKFRNLNPTSAPAVAPTAYGVAKPKPPQIPDYSFTLGFDYRYDLNMWNDSQFLIGADWYRTDDFVTAATNDFVLDGYDRINAFVGLGVGNWEGRLSVKNLTDEHTLSTGSRSLGGFLYLPPMEYMFTIKYKM
jgi:iron complex outermembrane receptor protein